MKQFIIIHFDPLMRTAIVLFIAAAFYVTSKVCAYRERRDYERMLAAAGTEYQPRIISTADAQYRRAFDLPAGRPQLTVIRGGRP